jgi:hypothetical protein
VAVIFTELPLQTEGLVAELVGFGLTVTVPLAVAEHPVTLLSVTVTVYDEVLTGVMVIDELVSPLLHK